VLLFNDPRCGPCNALLPDVQRWQREHRDVLTVAIVSSGEIEDASATTREHRLTHVFWQSEGEVSRRFAVQGTPTAVVIDSDRRIAGPPALGEDAVRAAVLELVKPSPSTTPAIGEPAPELPPHDLSGTAVDLEHTGDRDTLLLFFDPTCGWCQRMLPELRAWESERPAEAPNMLVLSTGSAASNTALALRSTVVADDIGVARSFGATGTPSGILIDAQGRVASGLAVGAEAILSLAGSAVTALGSSA
jgi:protein-disulfide isomerase